MPSNSARLPFSTPFDKGAATRPGASQTRLSARHFQRRLAIEVMSELGHERTSSALPIYVRFRVLSGHPMSASLARRDFKMRMSGFGGKGDAPHGTLKSPLIAISGHSLPINQQSHFDT